MEFDNGLMASHDKDGYDSDLVVLGESCGKVRSKYRDKLQFSECMEKEILEKEMLSDMTINYSLLLLHRQFPLTKGFEDTELGPRGLFSVQKGEFIQILFGDTHWILVHGDENPLDGEIFVYDSNHHYRKLSRTFVKQICLLRGTKVNKLNISIQAVQQQRNGVDCGILALCYAVDLTFNTNPVGRHYDLPKLRGHLYKCLTQKKFAPFPTSSRSVRHLCKPSIIHVEFHCTCRTTLCKNDVDDDGDDFMISCTQCKNFFHKSWEEVPLKYYKDQTLADTWKCSKCSQ